MRVGGIFLLATAVASTGCGFARSVNGGLFALPTTRDHVPVGGIGSVQLAVGHELLLGTDATVRATGDYAHLALGGHLALIPDYNPSGPYARLGFAPLAASYRDDTLWYAFNTSLEFGIQFSGQGTDARELVSTRGTHTAWTLGLRTDLEYRPGQDEVDVFLSLVLGFVGAEWTSFHRLF